MAIANGKDYIENAMSRKDLSNYGGVTDITFYYGKVGDSEKGYKGGFGISHIGAKHGKEAILHILDVIANGNISRYVEGNKTVILEKDGFEVLLALTKNGEKETWLFNCW